MSKTKEELNKIKEEVESVNEKLQELTEEEIAQVTGGSGDPVVIACLIKGFFPLGAPEPVKVTWGQSGEVTN